MKKRVISIVCALFFLLVLTLGVSAADQRWVLEKKDTILTGDGQTYEKYTFPESGYFLAPKELYYRGFIDSTYEVYTPTLHSDSFCVVSEWTYSKDLRNVDFYVAPHMQESFDRFMDGEYTTVRLEDPIEERANTLEKATLEGLNALPAEEKVDVTTLADSLVYHITVYDETDSIAYLYGAIYKDDYSGQLLYINYDRLDNSYFDAYGDFSYRRGTVEVAYLEGDLLDAIQRATLWMPQRTTQWYGNEFAADDTSEEDYAVLGWIIYAAIGFIFPILPFAAGIVLASVRKMGYQRGWYALSGLSVLWVTVAALFLVVVLLQSGSIPFQG